MVLKNDNNLSNKMRAIIKYVKPFDLIEFTGVGEGLGNEFQGSNFYNTPFTLNQFCLSLAICGHRMIDQLINDDLGEHYLSQLINNKVLKGLCIVDIGCGRVPTFARCARKLGAEVYTVDLVGADEFIFGKNQDGSWTEGFNERDRQIEVEYHIKENILDEKFIEKLKSTINKRIHLITGVQVIPIDTDVVLRSWDVDDIADRALESDDIYQNNFMVMRKV